MCIKVKEEMTNVRRLSALGVGCQVVHQLPNDTFPIHYLLLGVCKKQGGGKCKSDIIGILRAQNEYQKNKHSPFGFIFTIFHKVTIFGVQFLEKFVHGTVFFLVAIPSPPCLNM